MENRLEKWIKENYKKNDTLYYRDIKKRALEQINDNFKASKGWLYNFIKRKKLNLYYNIRKI